MKIEKYGRNWKVIDDNNRLVCITVYKVGAQEVLHLLQNKRLEEAQRLQAHNASNCDTPLEINFSSSGNKNNRRSEKQEAKKVMQNRRKLI